MDTQATGPYQDYVSPHEPKPSETLVGRWCIYWLSTRRRFTRFGRRELLYVGISQTFQRRMRQHSADKGWWDEVDTNAVRVMVLPKRVGTREQAEEIEAGFIAAHAPRYNKQGNWDNYDAGSDVAAKARRARGEGAPWYRVLIDETPFTVPALLLAREVRRLRETAFAVACYATVALTVLLAARFVF